MMTHSISTNENTGISGLLKLLTERPAILNAIPINSGIIIHFDRNSVKAK
jgi:hypothetical protein